MIPADFSGFSPAFPALLLALGISMAGAAVAVHPPASAAAPVYQASISIREAPWQVLVRVDLPDGERRNCGGSWLGGRWIVTAAHCVAGAYPGNTQVSAGITRLAESEADGARIPARRILPWPEYPRNPMRDIALIELEHDLSHPLARPIPYATVKDAAAGLTAAGVLAMASGWGNAGGSNPDGLHKLVTRITRCKIPKLADVGHTLNIDKTAAGSRWHGICQGDSGGPLAVRDATGSYWILAGVTSATGGACGDPARDDYFTRVSLFADWIRESTGLVTLLVHAPGTSTRRMLVTGVLDRLAGGPGGRGVLRIRGNDTYELEGQSIGL